MVTSLFTKSFSFAAKQYWVIGFRHEEYDEQKLILASTSACVECVTAPYLDSGPDDEHIEAPVWRQNTDSRHESTMKDAVVRQMNDIKSNVTGASLKDDE